MFHTGIQGGPADYLEGGKEDAWKAPPPAGSDAEEALVMQLKKNSAREKFGFSSARMQAIYLDTV